MKRKIKLDDIVGKKIDMLYVKDIIKNQDDVESPKIKYICYCECGNKNYIATRRTLTRKDRFHSCGCMQNININIGDKFGRLKVIDDLGCISNNNSKYKIHRYKCLCDCGKEKIISGFLLKSGNTKSCGCYMREKNSKLQKQRQKEKYKDLKNGILLENGEILKYKDIIIMNDFYKNLKYHKYCVYKCTNLENNKIYIGRTKNFFKRIKQHYSTRKKDYLFQKDILNYGIKKFKWEIIDFAKDRNSANEREKYWIEYYGTFRSEKGYNMTIGGDGGSYHNLINVFQLTKDNKFVKEYISIKEAERENNISNVSRCLNKINLSAGGYLWVTKEFYEKNKNNYKYVDTHNKDTKKQVVILDLNGNYVKEFDSISECSRYLGCSPTSLRKPLQCKEYYTRSVKKHMILYKNIYEKEKNNIKPFENRKGKYQSKGIMMFDKKGNFIEEFETSKQVQDKYGFSMFQVLSNCRGNQPSCHGYVFKFKK